MKYLKYSTALIILLLIGTGVSVLAQDADERQRLIERRNRLRARITKLQKEQNFLLFRKEMYAADSKYLVLDPGRGSGELRYRDRVIRNFQLTRNGAASPPLRPGAFVLSVREERGGKRRSLVFGNTFMLQTRHARSGGRRETEPVRFVLSSKDMSSLFSALDVGSRAYVVSR